MIYIGINLRICNSVNLLLRLESLLSDLIETQQIYAKSVVDGDIIDISIPEKTYSLNSFKNNFTPFKDIIFCVHDSTLKFDLLNGWELVLENGNCCVYHYGVYAGSLEDIRNNNNINQVLKFEFLDRLYDAINCVDVLVERGFFTYFEYSQLIDSRPPF